MVPFFDVSRAQAPILDDLRAAFERVLLGGAHILGPDVAAFEKEWAAYVGVEHAVGVSSGSDSLLAALMALGVGPGEEVLVPAFTFFSTAGSVYRTGAKPVFVDIDPDTLLMDVPAALRQRTAATRAIIPVHLFGQMVDVDPLLEAGLTVVEDAAQAHGSVDGKGRKAGSAGHVGCFSFFPTKPLGTVGDAGAVTTRDAALAQRTRLVRQHGSHPKFHHEIMGGNFRIDTLHAALLRAKLPHLDAGGDARRAIAAQYREELAPCLERGDVRLPALAPGRHVYHQHVIRAERRDALLAALGKQGIGAAVYYPEPLHVQPCFRELGCGPGDCPNAEAACLDSLALPCFPGLTSAEVSEVTGAIRAFYGA
jgi:dTDP-4-amino-4,6-dideoxygalactose transaminase